MPQIKIKTIEYINGYPTINLGNDTIFSNYSLVDRERIFVFSNDTTANTLRYKVAQYQYEIEEAVEKLLQNKGYDDIHYKLFNTPTIKAITSTQVFLNLIQKNQFVYFLDLDTEISEVNAFVCPIQKIPDDYLPSERSFFKESQYEKYASTLRNELQKTIF